MGWQNLAGAAAVGARTGGSGSGVPSWLLWGVVLVLAGAALFYAGAWLLRKVEELQEGRAAARRQKSYEEARRLGKKD